MAMANACRASDVTVSIDIDRSIGASSEVFAVLDRFCGLAMNGSICCHSKRMVAPFHSRWRGGHAVRQDIIFLIVSGPKDVVIILATRRERLR